MNSIKIKGIAFCLMILVFPSCKKEYSVTLPEEEPHPYVELIKGVWIEDSTQTLTSNDNGTTTIVVSTEISHDTIEVTTNKFVFSTNVSYIYGWSGYQDDIFGLWGDTKVNLLTNQLFIWTPSYYMLDINEPVMRHYCHKI